VANIMWAMTKLGYNADSEVLNKLESDVLELSWKDVEDADVINILWGFGKNGRISTEMVSLLEDCILSPTTASEERRIDSLSARCLSVILSSLAHAGHLHSPIFSQAAASITSTKLKLYHHQDLSNVMWALERAGVIDNKILALVGELLVNSKNLSSFSLSSLVNLAGVLSKGGVQDVRIYEQIENGIISCSKTREEKQREKALSDVKRMEKGVACEGDTIKKKDLNRATVVLPGEDLTGRKKYL
jgi:hypothetical protein